MVYQIKELANGIRIVHQEVTSTRLVHCGFVLDIGSRDEREDQEGLAHFWEHMAFKGTEKRKAFHIINRLDSVGGELNAYTTKEKICFYASVLQQHWSKAAELLCDITFNSTFPPRQIEKERQVILEEMAMYRDSPDDAIQDEFDDLLFPGHSLGYNILGTESTVSRFSQQDFLDFVDQHLDTSRIVCSVVGNISFKKALRTLVPLLGAVPATSRTTVRQAVNGYSPRTTIQYKEITQAHCALGKPALALNDERRFTLYLLDNILGGPSMNSRLNMALREKHGLAYSIESVYQPFTDTGFIGIFYGTEEKAGPKARRIVLREIRKIREKKLGTLQLHMGKEQTIGQMAMAEENYSGLMLVYGKSLLDKGYIESLEAIFKKIRSCTAEQLQELANEVYDEAQFSFLTYLPKPQ
ncbi:Predicted Zn-dependent peptidase [Cyclobacterium xiamenense]|uniref:Predicted Zn-dependent peptidase n=1 Tax=Cyclobacterium xiamenense TaxID=1297121 RepID=A0A1H6YVL5_9BACT|nr:pitrilysin family protein [Cyclobacterium xiamenense]SEJ41392.1 Predicted Zn-dependent peptidase [Cyclobacterium xiamenense]